MVITDRKLRSKGFVGLVNLGNTCYMNSVLQCLSNDIPMTKYLLSLDESKFSNNRFQEILYCFRVLLNELWGDNFSLKPTSLKRNINYNFDKYNNKKQHDAHEFLMDMLDMLDRSIREKTVTVMASKFSSKKYKQSVKEWLSCFNNKTSYISKRYAGQYQIRYDCRRCDEKFYKYDPFMSLMLEVPSKGTKYTTIDLLKKHLKYDFVNAKCEDCCTNYNDPDYNITEHEVTRSFFKLPDVLVLTLKRYDSSLNKLNVKIDVDKTLDFSDWYDTNSDDSVVYNLKSMICHEGATIDTGHYYSIIKRDGEYKVYDDTRIHHVDIEDYDDTTPYILFYEKTLNK